MTPQLDPIPAPCLAVLDRLSDWVDGELDPVAARDLERHLRACAACRRLACEMESTVLALRALGLPCCRG